MAKFDGFSINLIVEIDQTYLAQFIELPDIKASGETPDVALQNLDLVWEKTKNVYRQKNISIPEAISLRAYSGVFNIRIPKELHRKLAIEAQKRDISLNNMIVQKLSSETL